MFNLMNTAGEIRKDAMTAAALAAAALVAGSLMMYRYGMSEPDSAVMAAGMARMAAGEPLSSSMLYGRFLNPGIYYLFRALHPVLGVSPGGTIRFLNILGVLSWSALGALLYLVLRLRFDRTAAACSAAAAILTPVFWETGTYFHPIVPALALLAGAILVFERISLSPGGISALAATALLASAATVTRNEAFLAVPALVAAAAISSRPMRNVILVLALTAVSAAGFLLAAAAMAGDVPGGEAGFFRRFSSGLLASMSGRGLARMIPWALMATGTATVASICLALASGRGHARDSLPALLLAVPVSIMWLLWPIPVLRHFFIVVPALAFIFAGTVLKDRTRRTAVSVTAAVILINLFLPEILYRTHNSLLAESAKEPHGTFFYRHSLVVERIERFREMMDVLSARAAAAGAEAPGRIVVPVSWEMFGYASYCLAGQARHTRTEADPAADIRIHWLEADGLSVQLVYSGTFDLGRIDEATLEALERSAAPISTVIIPRELEHKTAGRLPGSVEFAAY